VIAGGDMHDRSRIEVSVLDSLITGSNLTKRMDFSFAVLNTNYHHRFHNRTSPHHHPDHAKSQ
jgi:hypothetical protein